MPGCCSDLRVLERPADNRRQTDVTADDATHGIRVLRTVTTREKLHLLVDQLSEAEVEAALVRLSQERELLRRCTATDDTPAAEDGWALANAREAIREEPW